MTSQNEIPPVFDKWGRPIDWDRPPTPFAGTAEAVAMASTREEAAVAMSRRIASIDGARSSNQSRPDQIVAEPWTMGEIPVYHPGEPEKYGRALTAERPGHLLVAYFGDPIFPTDPPSARAVTPITVARSRRDRLRQRAA